MAKKRGETELRVIETVEEMLRPHVEGLGYELCDVEFQKEHDNFVLTLFIDKTGGGITLEDCETVSRFVDPILDEEDPIEQQYYLSVSSLGIDRPLKKMRDFERSMGAVLEVRLYAPRNKKKKFLGELLSFDEDTFTIDVKGETMMFEKKDVALVRPHIDF